MVVVNLADTKASSQAVLPLDEKVNITVSRVFRSCALKDTCGSFTAAASKQLQEHRVADGEDDASDIQMSETKIEDVLPNSAEVASSFKRSDNDNSEQKNTDSRQASESNRRD